METIAEAWDKYREKVVPENCSLIQKMETRRAFYAGAQSMLTIVKAIGSDAISEDHGIAILEALQQEQLEFIASIHRGES